MMNDHIAGLAFVPGLAPITERSHQLPRTRRPDRVDQTRMSARHRRAYDFSTASTLASRSALKRSVSTPSLQTLFDQHDKAITSAPSASVTDWITSNAVQRPVQDEPSADFVPAAPPAVPVVNPVRTPTRPAPSYAAAAEAQHKAPQPEQAEVEAHNVVAADWKVWMKPAADAKPPSTAVTYKPRRHGPTSISEEDWEKIVRGAPEIPSVAEPEPEPVVASSEVAETKAVADVIPEAVVPTPLSSAVEEVSTEPGVPLAPVAEKEVAPLEEAAPVLSSAVPSVESSSAPQVVVEEEKVARLEEAAPVLSSAVPSVESSSAPPPVLEPIEAFLGTLKDAAAKLGPNAGDEVTQQQKKDFAAATLSVAEQLGATAELKGALISKGMEEAVEQEMTTQKSILERTKEKIAAIVEQPTSSEADSLDYATAAAGAGANAQASREVQPMVLKSESLPPPDMPPPTLSFAGGHGVVADFSRFRTYSPVEALLRFLFKK